MSARSPSPASSPRPWRAAVASRALACGALALLALLTSSCTGFRRWPWGSTQLHPTPMESTREPLPPGDSEAYKPGPDEVLVVRHADPVQVRPAGLAAPFPLSFYNKNLRVTSGSGVYSSPGGRAEVLWPGGNSIVLMGRSAGIVGSRTLGESALLLRQIERVLIQFVEEDQVELLGGARLSAKSGPFVLDHTRADILRIKNQSKSTGQIAYREAVLALDPGEVIDLPLLEAGSHPTQSDPGFEEVVGPGFRVAWSGQVDVARDDRSVTVRALGQHEVRGLGVRVRLERDETATFLPSIGSLRAAQPAASAAPAGAPPAPK